MIGVVGHGGRGFSLIEVVISVLVLGGVMAAVLNTVGATATIRRLDTDRVRGHALAMDLLDEIVARDYAEPGGAGGALGPEAGETGTGDRSAFDDVDDYDGWVGSPPSMPNGTVLPGLSGWSRSVKVVWASASDASIDAGSDTGLKRITVIVRSGDRIVESVSTVRAAAMDGMR